MGLVVVGLVAGHYLHGVELGPGVVDLVDENYLCFVVRECEEPG